MAKYLVTGGAGFLGSNIVASLVANGDKVIIYDNFSTGSKKNVQDYKQTEVRVVEGDVREATCPGQSRATDPPRPLGRV